LLYRVFGVDRTTYTVCSIVIHHCIVAVHLAGEITGVRRLRYGPTKNKKQAPLEMYKEKRQREKSIKNHIENIKKILFITLTEVVCLNIF